MNLLEKRLKELATKLETVEQQLLQDDEENAALTSINKKLKTRIAQKAGELALLQIKYEELTEILKTGKPSKTMAEHILDLRDEGPDDDEEEDEDDEKPRRKRK